MQENKRSYRAASKDNFTLTELLSSVYLNIYITGKPCYHLLMHAGTFACKGTQPQAGLLPTSTKQHMSPTFTQWDDRIYTSTRSFPHRVGVRSCAAARSRQLQHHTGVDQNKRRILLLLLLQEEREEEEVEVEEEERRTRTGTRTHRPQINHFFFFSPPDFPSQTFPSINLLCHLCLHTSAHHHDARRS